ncbi:hypothetical protein F2Q68_00044842 [Brassica cretica]|uniref:Uncharacterized protein n=1 Tax=Brassica cretica TaxID=69181 RepID=A0A8S9LNA7_BRACR|nr:hypothetical protein F2Q68_00044842 [Brassica cretica]
MVSRRWDPGIGAGGSIWVSKRGSAEAYGKRRSGLNGNEREIRDGNRGWNDGAKHEDRARSYKFVVINGQTGQHNKERDNREYYGKGKGKAFDAPYSKWVKAKERGSRRPPNKYGNYRGTGEGSQFKTSSREDVRNVATDVGLGLQESRNRLSSEQSRGDQEFQLELAKTQAEGTEVIMEATDEERGLLTVQGMIEAHDDLAEEIDMEMEALNAAMLEDGVDLEAVDILCWSVPWSDLRCFGAL